MITIMVNNNVHDKPRTKRATADEPIPLDENLFTYLTQLVEKTKWPYKVPEQLKEQLWARDQALFALPLIVGLRASEIVQGPSKTVGRKLNRVTNEYEPVTYKTKTYPMQRKNLKMYSTHILIFNAKTVKNGNIRKNLELPKKGGFALLTVFVEKWLNIFDSHFDDQIGRLHEEAYLFPHCTKGGFHFDTPMSTTRMHHIIKYTNGKFPHWARAVCETVYGKKVFKNDAWLLKGFMGIKNLDSTAPYVQGSWEDKKENLYKL